MKQLLFLLLLGVSTGKCLSQKLDHTWVIGHDNNLTTVFGRLVLRFDTSPPQVTYESLDANMNMFVMNVCISDSVGNLLFYSNGCDIADQDGAILPNGADINPGAYHTRLCDEIGRGYAAGYHGAVILPLPGNDSIYYFFHGRTLSSPQYFVDRLLYTVVKVTDTEKTVLEKNVPVVIDTLSFGEMNAVKHANGVDWWLIWPQRNSNKFYTFLFTKDGITDTIVQTLGGIPPAEKEGYGQTVFSPDGSRMIRYYPEYDVMDFGFDRASGLFTSYQTFSVEYGDGYVADGGCAISPSGQYLYVSATLQVYQFDLWATDISASQVKVAEWDGFLHPVAIAFYMFQMGPDCKLYIIGGGDTRYYHVIHNPDEAGLGCNFDQRGMVFPIPSGSSIPYFPNYRLGPIDNPGAPCSPIVKTFQPVAPAPGDLYVWPNPASRQVYIEAMQGATAIKVYDFYGRLVAARELSGSSEVYTLAVEGWQPGMYWVQVESARNVVRRGKVLVR